MMIHKNDGMAQKILNYALDYAPIILTVLTATVASLMAVRAGISEGEMLQLALAILALIATTQLIDRFRIVRNIDVNVERLLEQGSNLTGAKGFFFGSLPSLEERLRRAQVIAINGISLVGTSSSKWSVFKDMLHDQAQVRILVVDPEHIALELAAYRFEKHQDVNRLKKEVAHALDNFEVLRAQGPSTNPLQIRLLPFSPPYGIWMIDIGTPEAEIWVELYAFRESPEPAFQLLPHRDGEWFDFFQRQYELMWGVSKQWQP